jgi:hypothetical protein
MGLAIELLHSSDVTPVETKATIWGGIEKSRPWMPTAQPWTGKLSLDISNELQ